MNRIAINLPNPQYGLPFIQWASVVAEQLAAEGVQTPVNESAWQDWGAQLLNVSGLEAAPSPYGFARWEDWAAAFVGVPTFVNTGA